MAYDPVLTDRVAPEFGRKVGVHDAEFLDGLLAHDESEVGPFASALTAEEGLIEIGAVNVDGAVDPSGSGQAQLRKG